MGGIPHGGADEFAVEWGVLIRDMRVERRARLIAVAGIDGPNGLSATSGFESLPVGGTGCAIAPVGGELKLMLMISASAFAYVSSRMCQVAMRDNVESETPGHASAIRVSPRFMPSARMAV